MSDDPDLMAQFRSLRRTELAATPSFERVIGLARRRSSGAGWRGAVAACMLVAAVGWLTHRVTYPAGAPRIRTSAPALADWRAPTDFLLDTPAAELLQTVPVLGLHTPTGLDPLSPIGKRRPAARAGMEHS